MICVDLTKMTKELVQELQEREPDRKVTVDIEADMQLNADKQLLRIVMDNLLRNAWKYTGRQAEAIVTIGSKSEDGSRIFYVQDNGVGFDMSYAGKLFGAFQRMHNNSEFRGSGIGLATVQRIINHHSGKVWAEAEPGKGACFYFSIPEKRLSVEQVQ